MAAHTDTDDTTDDTADGAVELSESDAEIDTGKLPHHSFLSRLYTGTGAFEVIGRRRMWYAVSGAIVAIAVASIAIRGFTFGIDFKGGTMVSFPQGNVQTSQVDEVFRSTIGSNPEAVVIVGSGSDANVQIRSERLQDDQIDRLKTALVDAFHPDDGKGHTGKEAISDSNVSETWGAQITQKALIGLLVFLVLVSIYITARYERYMAISALASMFFDVGVTAGVYSLVGFEVTPATVIGLMTILGFSIYDTVIVFDKVEENTHGFQHTTRRTYAEQANLAVNQTLMRSINTSLISVLPVIALLVVAVWLLGVGMLKDLALVQLIGIIVGTYSSIFFATPLLVTMRERTELVRVHTRRVLRRRGQLPEKKPAKKRGKRRPEARPKARAKPTSKKELTDDEDVVDEAELTDELDEAGADQATEVAATRPASKPAPGARPVRPSTRRGRPTGKHSR